MADGSVVPTWVLLSVPTVTGVAAIVGATVTVWRGNRGAETRADAVRLDEWKNERRKSASAVVLAATRAAAAGRAAANISLRSGTGVGSFDSLASELETSLLGLQAAIASFHLVEDPRPVAAPFGTMELAATEMRELVTALRYRPPGPPDSTDLAELRRDAASIEAAIAPFAETMRVALAPVPEANE